MFNVNKIKEIIKEKNIEQDLIKYRQEFFTNNIFEFEEETNFEKIHKVSKDSINTIELKTIVLKLIFYEHYFIKNYVYSIEHLFLELKNLSNILEEIIKFPSEYYELILLVNMLYLYYYISLRKNIRRYVRNFIFKFINEKYGNYKLIHMILQNVQNISFIYKSAINIYDVQKYKKALPLIKLAIDEFKKTHHYKDFEKQMVTKVKQKVKLSQFANSLHKNNFDYTYFMNLYKKIKDKKIIYKL